MNRTLYRQLFIGWFLIAGAICFAQESITLPNVPNTLSPTLNWKLIWSDEFDTDGTPDPSKWGFPGRKPSAWAKFATKAPEIAYVKDGALRLIAQRTPTSSRDTASFQTGALSTQKRFSFLYGKIEIKARFKGAKGAWPALWLMPLYSKYGGWPKSGEIDIMEHLNHDSIAYQTVHTTYTRRGDIKDESAPSHGTAPIAPDDYNIYSLTWDANKIILETNGKVTFVYTKDPQMGSEQYPFDTPFYIIVNQALGGKWVGNIDQEQLPTFMDIDWIRVYQEK